MDISEAYESYENAVSDLNKAMEGLRISAEHLPVEAVEAHMEDFRARQEVLITASQNLRRALISMTNKVRALERDALKADVSLVLMRMAAELLIRHDNAGVGGGADATGEQNKDASRALIGSGLNKAPLEAIEEENTAESEKEEENTNESEEEEENTAESEEEENNMAESEEEEENMAEAEEEEEENKAEAEEKEENNTAEADEKEENNMAEAEEEENDMAEADEMEENNMAEAEEEENNMAEAEEEEENNWADSEESTAPLNMPAMNFDSD